MENTLKRKTVSSLTLKLSEKVLTLGLQLVISIVLARLLSPNDYGIIGLVNVFIALSNVFVESGFGVGLVRKKELTRIDTNTVFYSSLAVAAILYGIVFVVSPFIADFYKNSQITAVLRIYALSIVFGSISSVHNSLVSRELKYSKQLVSTLVSIITSGAIGIILAYQGLGVWALVYQQIIQKVVYTIVISFFTKFFPRLEFSFNSFREIVGFTWKIVLARLVSVFFNEVNNLVIGKKYGSEQLGYYNKGNQLPSAVATSVDYSLQSVMFSVYSKKQDDVKSLHSMLQRTIKMTSFLLFPMMFGMIGVAHNLVIVVLTEKWLPCVMFMQIACLAFMFQSFVTSSSQAVNALGKSSTTLKEEVARRIFTLALIVGAIFINVEAIAWSVVIAALFGFVVYVFVNKKIFSYSIKEQLKDVLQPFLLSVFMCFFVYSMGCFPIAPWINLIIQVISGAIMYLGLCFLLGLDSFKYCTSFIRDLRQKKANSKF